MPLKLTLKPQERVIIGKAFITNGDAMARIFVENKVPILRQKDILTEKEAGTPCEKIYFCVQMMYLDSESIAVYHQNYWNIVREVLEAAPSLVSYVEQISELILEESYYSALKKTKQLIKREQELINHATQSA